MKKFKLLLIVFLLPITFIIYYLTSEEFGILSLYYANKKSLDKIKLENKNKKRISYYS